MRVIGYPAALAAVMALTGCAAVNDLLDPTPPAGTVQLRVYAEGFEADPRVQVSWATTEGAGEGVVAEVAEAACLIVGATWELSIVEEFQGAPLARARHDQFSGVSSLDLTAHRDPAGRVTLTEGRPAWATGEPPACDALAP